MKWEIVEIIIETKSGTNQMMFYGCGVYYSYAFLPFYYLLDSFSLFINNGIAKQLQILGDKPKM